jgi:hypothetical protein
MNWRENLAISKIRPTVKLDLRPLDASTLEVFRNLMASKEFGGCFCAVWTSKDQNWESRCKDKSQPNFFITQKNILDGKHVGYLIYENGDLVGWTGSGPKTSFPLLKEKLGSRLSEFSSKTWSIGCISLVESARGRNLSDSVVKSVIKIAREKGAKKLEAYPTRPFHEPRIYRGNRKIYERLGFSEVAVEKDGEYEILLLELPL